jgi:hypothetical protein
MEAQALTGQGRKVWEKIKQDLPSQYRPEVKNLVEELSGRVDFVSSGQTPRTKTSYQSLEASALAQQARHVVSQVSRNLPIEQRQRAEIRESLEIIETLADRVEFAAIGSPSAARPRTTAGPSKGRSA